MKDLNTATFYNLVDLASKELGGKVLLASDDYFADMENIINRGRGEWDPDLFYERGKVYDGWESRRNRTPEINDWIIVKLARPGIINVVDIDTNHFLGNAPQFASLEGSNHFDLQDITSTKWETILEPISLKAGRQNLFHLPPTKSYKYVRLQIYPDGGVARLRLYGSPQTMELQGEQDYASVLNGGRVLLASDMFFGEMSNLIKPNKPINMGDGWETKRRRSSGHDWVIIKLGKPILPNRIIVDTTHFKGNYPDHCAIDICTEPDLKDNELENKANWVSILENYKLGADSIHTLDKELDVEIHITHLRLRIYPDGGIARIRVIG